LEQRGGQLQSSALNVINAATKLGNPVTAFVAGSPSKEVAEQAAKVAGVDNVVYVKNGAYDKV
jgi:electron transfer flavoprotein alpha subunit